MLLMDNYQTVKPTQPLTSAIKTSNDIVPPLRTRSLIVGKTGSGKSTLEDKLILSYPNDSVIVLDPKCTTEVLDKYTNTDDLGKLPSLAKNNNVVVYRPEPTVSGLDHWEKILKWVYDRQNTILVIDELYGLTENGRTYPNWLRGIYTRGRERGITTIGCSQRPVGIPRYCRTEDEQYYVFFLGGIEDRKTMAQELGNEILTPLDEFAFWFIKNRKTPRQLRVKL